MTKFLTTLADLGLVPLRELCIVRNVSIIQDAALLCLHLRYIIFFKYFNVGPVNGRVIFRAANRNEEVTTILNFYIALKIFCVYRHL